jgi:hypothetical protein
MALSPAQAAVMRGHPTSPGVRDFPGVSASTNLPTTSADLSTPPMGSDQYTKDGKPGRPRYVYPLPRDYHADTGNIGSTPNGPKQPGIQYRGEVPGAGFEPWVSRNEKLRRQAIAAAQSGAV